MSLKQCIECNSVDNKEYKWYKGPTCRSCYYKKYHSNRRDVHLMQMKQRRDVNKEHDAKIKSEWIANNKQRHNEYKRLYKLNRYHSDENFRLLNIVRRQINRAIKGEMKELRSIEYIGCSIDELKIHLESKFQPGMTWNNYGEWQIDHIRPLSSFTLTETVELRAATHYSNLQPLWKSDNLSKGRKYG